MTHAIVLVLALLLAPAAAAQTLEALLSAAAECPEPACPPPPRPLGWDVTIGVPAAGWPPETRVELSIRLGLRTAEPWGRCGILTARAVAPDGQASDEPSLASSPECVPVPEPGFEVGAGFCALCLASISRSRALWMSR